jgi:hypothetical protein
MSDTDAKVAAVAADTIDQAITRLDEARDVALWQVVMLHLQMVRALGDDNDDYYLMAMDLDDLLDELHTADVKLRAAKAAALAADKLTKS